MSKTSSASSTSSPKTRVLRSPFQRRRRNLALSSLAIFTAVLATWLVIENSNPKEQFLIATRGMGAGSELLETSLELAPMQLSNSGSRYLQTMPVGKVFLIASVRPGELIPLAQLTKSLEDTRIPVQVSPDMNLSGSIKPGSVIDLWASRSEGSQIFAEPRILALGAEVSEIFEPSGMFTESGKSVEIMVHPDDLQPILYAIASGDKFAAILKPTLLDQ